MDKGGGRGRPVVPQMAGWILSVTGRWARKVLVRMTICGRVEMPPAENGRGTGKVGGERDGCPGDQSMATSVSNRMITRGVVLTVGLISGKENGVPSERRGYRFRKLWQVGIRGSGRDA